jgi:hypothetical protein
MLIMRKIPGIFPAIFFLSLATRGQDNHYEYLKLGSRNSILANAGISRFEDQSAVIVNPATLSYATGSSFSFNTTAVGISNITFENGLGQGFDIKYGNLNILPNMAAGVLKPKKNEKDFVLGYGIYHRLSDKLRFTDRQQATIDVLDNSISPGLETYIAQYNLGHEVDEVSGIFGIGWNLTKRISIGLSQTFTYHSEEYSESFSASAVPAKGQGATIDVVAGSSDFYAQYFKIITQTKVGLAAMLGRWDVGLTVGLPSLGIMGQGEVMSEATLTNIQLPGKPRGSYYANGRAEKIKSKYKYAMSAGLGISRPINNVRIYFGANWYGGLDPYTVIDPGNVGFIQPVTDSNVLYTDKFMRVYAQSKSVFNGSVGADWTYNENKHLLVSFHSDGHFALNNENEPGRQLSVKIWDNYHIAVGTQQSFKSSDWMIGVRYSFAKLENALQPFSFDNPTEDNYLQGERTTGTLKATSFQFMLSYSFRFGQKTQ